MRTSPGTLCESPSPSVEPSLVSPLEEEWSFCQEGEQHSWTQIALEKGREVNLAGHSSICSCGSHTVQASFLRRDRPWTAPVEPRSLIIHIFF